MIVNYTTPPGPLSTTQQRVKAFIEKGLSVRDIANLEGISTQAIYKHLKALGIPPPSEAEEVAS